MPPILFFASAVLVVVSDGSLLSISPFVAVVALATSAVVGLVVR
jgi:hypothetical protein